MDYPLSNHLLATEVDRQTIAATAAMVYLGRALSSWSSSSMVVEEHDNPGGKEGKGKTGEAKGKGKGRPAGEQKQGGCRTPRLL